jgi:hypothetical protein
MKKSRKMSRQNKGIIPAAFLPSIPIDVRFEAWPYHTWRLVRQEDDCLFECSLGKTSYIEKKTDELRRMLRETFSGAEYVESILRIETPEELVEFMNTYTDIQNLGQKQKYEQTGQMILRFHWSAFLEVQSKLTQAMVNPIPKLLRHNEFGRAFRLEELEIKAQRKGERYYGEVTLGPTLPSCYRVIAVARLLGKVEYDRCVRCHRVFQVTNRHERKFCLWECAHAAAQQSYREREGLKRK